MQSLVPNRTRTRSNQKEQYGIDMAHILDTKSDLKTAKLRQEGLENELAIEEATDLEHGNFLAKDDPDSKVEPKDENQDGKIDETETQNALRATGRKWNAKREQEKLTEGRTDKDLDRKYAKNTDSRAGGRYSMAKEKHDRWRSENKKADKIVSDMEKVTTDTLVRGGMPLETAQAIAKSKVSLVNAHIKKVAGMTKERQEQAIDRSNTMERQYFTLLKEKDLVKLTANINKGKEKADGDLRVAKASGDPVSIEIAEENVARFGRLTDDKGNGDPAKITEEYKTILAMNNKLKKQYGETESKKEMTALQAEKLKRDAEKTEYKKERDKKKDTDKKTKTEKDLADKNEKAVKKASDDKAKRIKDLYKRQAEKTYRQEDLKALRESEERANRLRTTYPDEDEYQIKKRADAGEGAEDRKAYKEDGKVFKIEDGVKYEADKKSKKWKKVN